MLKSLDIQVQVSSIVHKHYQTMKSGKNSSSASQKINELVLVTNILVEHVGNGELLLWML